MKRFYDVKKIFGHNLKNLRESKNLTQENLAELLNLQTYQTINRIENARSFISSELLEKICNYFQIEPYELFLASDKTCLNKTNEQFSKINRKLDDIYKILINNK